MYILGDILNALNNESSKHKTWKASILFSKIYKIKLKI